MAHEFRIERRVSFAETDMAGILHFSNYFRYMEEVEHAFFRSLGLRVHVGDDDGVLGFARREATCSYARPLRYEDVVELHLVVREKRTRALRYDVTFRLDGTDVAHGGLTVVAIGRRTDGTLEAVPMPPAVAERVDVAPAD